ncbi:MAG: hypothetical protein ACK5O2_16555 [Microthrixaceae bacterium]
MIFVLMVIMFSGIIMVALSAYASTSAKVTETYTAVKQDRYAGDGAIQSAVNWIKDQPGLAVDPEYAPDSNDDCVYDATTDVGTVTVSCFTAPGSGSGVPPEQGALPPETLLLTGDRHNEPGPYSYAQCDSAWDSIVNFFTGDTPGRGEDSLRLEKSRRQSVFGLGPCQPRNRGNGPVQVKGAIVAAGRASGTDGLNVAAYNGDGTLRAKRGCSGLALCGGSWITNRSAPGKPWNNTPSESDPGRKTPIAQDPINNIRDEFLPIGFQADGSLRSGYKMPNRTTAYVYDETYNTGGDATNEIPKYMKPIANCTDVPAGATIIFLPGWYKSADVLTRYTANSACPDRTFWFTPRADFSAGGSRELLQPDNETGAFYMDFTNTSTAFAGCGDMHGAVPARWCLGGYAANSGQATLNSKPRVVVGWPNGWEPFPSGAAGGGTPVYGTPVGITIDTVNSVEGSLLSYWSNRSNAQTIDSQYATYKPCSFNFIFFTINCPSFGQRTLRLADLTPKTTGGPVAETGAPNGRVYLEVRYGLKNPNSLNTPQVDVDALDSQGIAKDCGTYDLTKSGVTFGGTGPLPASSKYVFNAAQAKQLADNCGAVELLNNLRVTFKASGNIWNSQLPEIYLDGVKFTYNSYAGASFPVGENNAYNSQEPAKSDCDKTKPGGQLIFGGESHAYVADGSLEVCGGPDPDNPAEAQVIGIYGVPAVETLRPTSAAIDGGSAGSNGTQLVNAGGATRIGDPAGGSTDSATIKYPGRCIGAIGIGPCDPIGGGAKDVRLSFPQFSLGNSTAYRVKKVEARSAYRAEGPFLGFTAPNEGAQLKAGSCVEDARTTNHELRQWANEGTDSANKLVLYQYGTSRNCIPSSTLTSTGGSQVRWKTNVPGGWGVVFGGRCFVFIGWCNYTQEDQLDGVELDVTIEPVSTSVPMLRPQSGCVVAHPNYTGGESEPDCAVIRADSFSDADQTEGSQPLRGTWVGRVSVKGTIYAPSSAVEIDDNDIGYPLATRGAILRHLRISGAKKRTNFNDPWFGGTIDDTPLARRTVLTACVQSPARQAANPRVPCDADQGDQIVTKAGARFLPPENPTPGSQADAPVMEWWSDRRTAGAS